MSVGLFSKFAEAEHNKALDEVQRLPNTEIDCLLRHFYAKVRKRDGSLFSHGAMVTIRYGLQKHFRRTCSFDIVNDSEFSSSAEAFSAVLVDAKSHGQSKCKQLLSPEDFHKLYSSNLLSTDNPRGLQNKVFVDLMMHLCNGSRENLRSMKKADFCVRTDSAGKRYVSVCDKQRRNDSGEQTDASGIQRRRMYSVPGNPKCPVMSFEKYVAKLNRDVEIFCQKPSGKKVVADDFCWYDRAPLGKNALGDKMKTLSVEAGLSVVYPNHCLHETCIRVLDYASLEAAGQDTSVSGQKPEASSRPCSRNDADDTTNSSHASTTYTTAVDNDVTVVLQPTGGGNERLPDSVLNMLPADRPVQRDPVVIDRVTAAAGTTFNFYNCTVYMITNSNN